ncbi:MAG TPA: bifunctional nuclease family protein [Anaerolineaceae bacterium]|nr:bifunctional nuclease family protein [Anaerolineaceae bacterium]
MTECEIDSVRVSLTNQDRVVVLKDKNSERYLPIWIGLFESESLTIALQGVQTARPLTHDLLLNTIHSLGAQFIRVEIVSIEEDVYFAQLVLLMDGKQVNIDCRPSDALVLLVRARVPIFVSEEIMSTAAIQPEDRRPYDLSAEPVEDDLSDADDLSIFSDFLSTLDLDKDSDNPEPITDAPPKTLENEISADDLLNDIDEIDDDISDDDLDIDDILFGPTINNN